ncbi:btl, partial [Drosophila busckii]
HLAPQLSAGYPRNVSVEQNQSASLECKLEATQLEPQISWLHQVGTGDIQALVQRLQSRSTALHGDAEVEPLVFNRNEPQLLRLGYVQPADAGWYICVAENQVARTVVAAYLQLLSLEQQQSSTTTTTTTISTPAPSSSLSDNDDEFNDEYDEYNKVQLEAPRFKKPLTRLQHWVAGRTVVLSCPAVSHPPANISWTRNNAALDRVIGVYNIRRWSLTMVDIISADSGIYKCRVCNILGCIEFEFSVSVFDRLRFPPIFNKLENKTVLVNSDLEFSCDVISDMEPTIHWLRAVQPNHSLLLDSETQLSNVSRDLGLIKLNTSIDQVHKLLLHNITHEQEGWYTCVASSTLGSINASLYVHVVDQLSFYQMVGMMKLHSLGFTVIALVILLIFLLGCAFIFYMLRRLRRENLLKHRIETVHQWTKKVIIYKAASLEGSGCAGDLQIPVIKIEKQRTTFSNTSTGDALPAAQGFNEYEFPLDANWEIPRQQLSLGSILGEGAFGRVVMAEAEDLPRSPPSANGTIVAVKMVKEEHTDADMASLVREMEVMKMIGKHINIINLLGCCSQSGPLWVIVEFAPHGNLKDFLKQRRPGTLQRRSDSDGYLDDKSIEQLGEKQLTMFAFQIARGMDYLASRRCIHRDLAARNVLVADGYVMKIADFGLARDIQD